MAASRRAEVLRLYRALLRESQAFSAYGYRTYAIRKIRDAFRENKNIKESSEIDTLINKAKTNLEMMHRQVSYQSIKLETWYSIPFLHVYNFSLFQSLMNVH
ncbi:LYR motif-containing protein 4 isoform X1 [Thamnophis elegans]|uniref:LYR motif-containing protein 4 isoform X1 n=1 Tax=Thamnophis elegans TaxID=35005 RepID=UPI001378EBED|nr:LYR motif-containing protein 4 isoform X1 [Thamnophis elegans]